MTGVERLQGISMAFGSYAWGASLSEALGDIADQVAREHAEDCFRMGERAADVSMSAYDLLPEDEREAIAWVREHGGIGCVQTMVTKLNDTLDWIRGRAGVSKYEIVDYDELLDSLARRLMPEGYEWPRYDTGEPVRFGDEFLDHQGNVRSVLSVKMFQEGGFEIGTGQGTYDWYSAGERVGRPAVLAADGEPLKVGQTVWDTDSETGTPLTVVEVSSDLVRCEYTGKDGKVYKPCYPPATLTHQRPVLDADGVPICEGDTVWHIKTGREYVVVEPSYGETVVVRLAKYDDAEGEQYAPDQLTHAKPEIDTWERIEEDVTLSVDKYRERYGIKKNDGMTWPQQIRKDLVRRCRALAERERGE